MDKEHESENENEIFMSAREAARTLGYHLNHVYRLLAQDRLHGVKFGGGWAVYRESVEEVKRRQDDSGRVRW